MGETRPKTELDNEYRDLVSSFLERVVQSKGWTNQDALAEALGVSRPTASRYVSKDVRAPLQSLLRLEETLGIPVPHDVRAAFNALAGVPTRRRAPSQAASDSDDSLRLSRSMPIISTVAAGKLLDPTTQIEGEHQTIEISGLPPGDYFATRVQGTSMNRISPPGSLIVVNRAERELVRGRRYIFSRRGETTYKRFEVSPFRLEPETTDPDANPTIFPKSEEEWLVIGRVRVTLLDDL